LYSQNVDSIYTKYKNTIDLKSKSEILLEYGNVLIQHDIDSALSCSKIAINIGKNFRILQLLEEVLFCMDIHQWQKGSTK